MENHSPFKKLGNASLKISFLLFTLLFQYIPASADVIEYDQNGTDFTLNYENSIFNYDKNNNFEINDYVPPAVKMYENAAGTGVMLQSRFHVNSKESPDGFYDYGFIKFSTVTGGKTESYPSEFVISGYASDKEKFIDWIEIRWSNIEPCGGKLWLNGSETTPYFLQNDLSVYQEGSSVTETLIPTTENDGVVRYNFQSPVRYLALAVHPDAPDDFSSLARISYIKVHFVEEWTAPEPQAIQVQIGNPDEPKQNIEWDRNGMDLVVPVIITGKNSDNLSSKNLNLTFTLTPQFKATSKPDWTEDNHEGTIDAGWRLYKVFENHPDKVYDGFLEDVSPITCDAKFVNNQHGDDNYLVNIPAPVSGLYTLSVSSEDFEIEANGILLNVWPGIRNYYGDLWELEFPNDETKKVDPIYKFSINWINFDDDDQYQQFNYPYDEEKTGPHMPTGGTIFIPGLYDAKIYYKWNDDFYNNHTPQPIAEDSTSETPSGYSNAATEPLDLSELKSSELQLLISKNNALTPIDDNSKSAIAFIMKLDETRDVPTAVRAIENVPADVPAEYYNLGGLRVNEKSLLPGIYIRRTGTQTEKILVR